jgi:hypothetical protein
LALYEAILQRGFQLSEVAELEFETPTELKLQLDIIQARKDIEALKQGQLKASEAVTASTTLIDTGGPTRTGEAHLKQVQERRSLAVDLKKQGKYRDATWVALDAARADPKKVLGIQQE